MPPTCQQVLLTATIQSEWTGWYECEMWVVGKNQVDEVELDSEVEHSQHWHSPWQKRRQDRTETVQKLKTKTGCQTNRNNGTNHRDCRKSNQPSDSFRNWLGTTSLHRETWSLNMSDQPSGMAIYSKSNTETKLMVPHMFWIDNKHPMFDSQ